MGQPERRSGELMEENSVPPKVVANKGRIPSLRGANWGVLKKSPGLKRLAGDSLWVGLGQVGIGLGTLVGMRMLTSFIPPAIFGSISLLLSFATLATSTFCQPYLQAMVRFYPEVVGAGQVGHLRRIITVHLEWCLGLIGGAILVGGAIAARELGISYFAIAALVVLLAVDNFRSLELSIFSATRRHRLYALWQNLDSWVRPLLAIVAVMIMGATPEAVLAGYALGSLSLFLAFCWMVKREGIDKERIDEEDKLQLRSRLRKYAFPLLPLAIVAWVSAVSDRYIIGGMLGLEAVGIYVAGYSIISRAFILTGGTLELILRPVYYEAVAVGSGDRARKAFKGWLVIMVICEAVGVLGVILFNKQICRLLVAEPYWETARLMPWIAGGYALVMTSYVFEKVCYAYQKTGWVTLSQVIGAIASIVLTIPLIALYGLDGAAMAVPVYFALQLATVIVGCSRLKAKEVRNESK